MEYLQDHPLAVTLILLVGMSLFVRLVAKEKHRRDKHLLARLQAKLSETADKPA